VKRVIVAAENALLVEAVRIALRDSPALELVGYVDARKASPNAITEASPDVVLVDDMDQSEESLVLIRSVHEADERIAIVVLSMQMDRRWLQRAFAAGAMSAISKAIQPGALATLVRETINGNVMHSPTSLTTTMEPCAAAPAERSSLTKRELEILQWLASGATNCEIARALWVTEQTVKFHVSNIYRKLGVANRTEACNYAHLNGLLVSKSGTSLPTSGTSLPVAS
jgi:DNA-binding NarL/FixJ family response regulator